MDLGLLVTDLAVPLGVAVVGTFTTAAAAYMRRSTNRRLRRMRGIKNVPIPPDGPNQGPSPTVEEQLAEIGVQMSDSSRRLELIKAEIDAFAATAKRLKAEADEAERLAQLNEEGRDAVARVVRAEIRTELRAELEKEARESSRRDFRRDLLFFLGGALLSLAVTLFVHPLT